MRISIIVVNYNGKELLAKYLPSLLAAANKSKYQCSVGVIDNLSTDGSVDFIRNNFLSVEVFLSQKNEVICSYNAVLERISSDIVIMLNNDIEVKDDFVDYLVEHFNKQDVFFVAPRILNFDNSYNGGKSYLKFSLGLLKCIVDEKNSLNPGYTDCIGTGAFRRSTFVELGGFDRLYLPGIWEEVDLCYRGLLSGKRGVYEPRSIIWHQDSITFNKIYGRKKKAVLAHRNMFLFIWKNIFDFKLILQHILFLPFRLIYSLITGKNELFIGFMQALAYLPVLTKERASGRENLKLRRLRDRDIIK